MIEFYVHENQLVNFLVLKEPAELVVNPISDRHVKLLFDVKKVRVINYKTYSTIEILTFRKKVRLWMRRFKRKK